MTQLDRIARHLLLNGAFTSLPGLLTGKTGIALFMLRYAAYRHEEQYRAFGTDLLREAFARPDIRRAEGFADGLAGMAWGAEHLLLKGLIDRDDSPLPALHDFDEAVYGWYHEAEWGLRSGLAGYMLYLQSRIAREGLREDDISTMIRYEVYINMVERLERVNYRKNGPVNAGFVELITTKKYPPGAKHIELSNYAKVITMLAKSLRQGIYPAIVGDLLTQMTEPVLTTFEQLDWNGRVEPDELLMQCIAQIEAGRACWNAGCLSGNDDWRHKARQQMRLTALTAFPRLASAFGDIRYLRVTIQLTQIIRRAALEIEDPVFASAFQELSDHLMQLAGRVIEKEDDNYLGIDGGLAGIGLVLLSGLDPEACCWDEMLLLS